MKCPKCGAEISENAKFCSYCGYKIETTTPPIVNENVSNSDDMRDETVNFENKEPASPKSIGEKIKDKVFEKWHSLSVYGKATTISGIIFLLLCLTAFLFGKTAAGIVAILQIILIVVAMLMKKNIIKVPKNWLYILIFALAFILLFPYISLFRMNKNDTNKIDNINNVSDADKLVWSDIVLADVVPEPKSHLGKVINNSAEHLSVYVYEIIISDYNEYIESCKSKGFTVKAEESDHSYDAYNTDGYKLSLYYDESVTEMQISIDAPEQYGTLTWSDSAIPGMLPMPTSANGEIVQDSETGFRANIGNTSFDDFKGYVTACADAGFNIDVYESDESYTAENSEGYKLSLSYQWNKVMSISVDEPEYEVSVEIECVENLLFSKYNVDVYIDDMLEGTIEHGTTKTFNTILAKGTYEIKFVNAENEDVTGMVEINIHQDETLKYKISCASDKIGVETIVGTVSEHGEDEIPIPQSASSYMYGNYKDVQKELTDAGFTNISFEILYDIVLEWTDEGEVESISVDGNTDFEKNDIFKKDAPIVITYHMKEEDDPAKPVENESVGDGSEISTQKQEETEEQKQAEAAKEAALEDVLPKEMAKRALVVAMTNCSAIDVFAADGNSYDTTKFHSYDDIDDFFLTVDTDGVWTALNDSTWHVEDIILRMFDYDTCWKVTCDISMDENNYVISNVDQICAAKEYINSEDPSKISMDHLEPSENNPFLTVPSALVESDRDDVAVQEKLNKKEIHDDWVNSQFSIWDGAHKTLEKLIKKQLNDEKSYKHIETTYISIDNDEQKVKVNNILENAGCSQRVELDDLFIITEFSAKNYFNATIKQTAYGIADYSTNEIILVAIK